MKNRGSLLLLRSVYVLVVALILTPPLAAAKDSASELRWFVPEGVEELYRAEDCALNVPYPCTLWVAGASDSRYMIFHPALDRLGAWRDIPTEDLVRAVAPKDLVQGAWRIERLAKFRASDPDTFTVNGAESSGRVQVIEQPDQVLIIWMPDSEVITGFDRVMVTLVDTPPPQTLKEIAAGGSADVVSPDSSGFIWYSIWENEIYRIDPVTDVPEPMTGRTALGAPDGLVVDSNDSVWYGAYQGRYMGGLASDSPLTRYDMPYAPSNPAIPCVAPNGNIWITDHLANRVTEFDPVGEEWLRSFLMPMPAVWVTECTADPAGPILWMTWYNVRRLGRLSLSMDTIDSFSIPCQPAFLKFDANGKIWTTCWNNGNIVQFDPMTLTGTEYVIPNSSQAGGISIAPNGRVVFTQNPLARVAVLDPVRAEVYTYDLSRGTTFKDGVLVDRSGTIWAPSPYGRRVGKIVP